MKLYGWCISCRRMRQVRVLSIRRAGVQLGTCADCENRKTKT